MGLREEIFEIADLAEEPLTIPEWKNKLVLIRTLTGDERAKLLQHNMLSSGRPDLLKMYPALAIASVRDPETHELVFKLADRDTLNTKSGAALERIAGVAMRLNNLSPETIKETKEDF
jgi:hypothetical protein